MLLNTFQYSKSSDLEISNEYSVSALSSNDTYDELCLQYYKQFHYNSLKTFAFTKEGFLGLLLELHQKTENKIAVSVGETQALIDGAKLYESLGFEIQWIGLKKDGTINLYDLKDKNIDFLFVSSYVMDTFVKTDLEKIKKFTKTKIISNGTADISKASDVIYFDNYKLTGFNVSGVLLFDNNMDIFELLAIGQIDTIALKICFDKISQEKQNYKKSKKTFLEELEKKFNDDIYFFIDNTQILNNTIHLGLKGIKARELIRTMALSKIFISNGEGCSLGLSKPSRIIKEMGYEENVSRTSISLTFDKEYSKKEIDEFINTLYLKYKQLKMLG